MGPSLIISSITTSCITTRRSATSASGICSCSVIYALSIIGDVNDITTLVIRGASRVCVTTAVAEGRRRRSCEGILIDSDILIFHRATHAGLVRNRNQCRGVGRYREAQEDQAGVRGPHRYQGCHHSDYIHRCH